MDEIMEYKINGTLPNDPQRARYVKARDSWFVLWKGQLYKKSFTHPLLKCITPEKGGEVLDDIHEGQCGSHIGGRALAEKALRTGYYWPSLRQDATELVKKCHKCQVHAPLHQKPANYLNPILSPLPFAKWGMDILGPFPQASGQRKFVLVAVDYFTKWVEAEPMKSIKTADVQGFIWKNLITRFGVPQSIVFDNGPQFETPRLRSWLADQGIAAHFAAVGHPQANGQVEAFNKVISDGIKKKLDKAGGLWADELLNVLWSVRTTIKNSTGESPFKLVYGAEAVLPIEMYEPTLRVMLYDEDANWEYLKTTLDLLPEARGNALLRQEVYKLRMTRDFNKRVKFRPLRVGDLVLRKMESLGRAKEDGKLTPNWEGPYKIVEQIKDSTYKLQTMDGMTLPRAWNADTLRKYHV